MRLDLAQLELTMGGTMLVCAILFITDSWSRQRDVSDRMWALALIAVVTSNLAGLFWDLSPSMWTLAIHHSSLVAGVFSVWSGTLAADGRRPLTFAAPMIALPVAVAVLLPGPDAPSYAGSPALLVAVAGGCLATSVVVFRGTLRTRRGGFALGAAMGVLGTYSLFRLAVFVTAGPTSEAYERLAAPTATGWLTGLGFVTAAFAMLMLRSAHAPAMGTVRFDVLTGARLPAAFTVRATHALAEADRLGHDVCLARIEPEDIAAIEVAFGRGAGAEALATAGELTAAQAPPGAVFGLSESRGFEVLLPAVCAPDAHAWATTLRKAIIDAPLDLTGGSLRLTVSVGIAAASVHGYSLGALRAAAEVAVDEALAAGGNRARVAEERLEARP